MARRAHAGGEDARADGADLYALLNVPRHAPRDQIKAAYTRLARALHPDKSSHLAGSLAERSEAQELFILVDRAYKVLSDETERAVYDRYGHEGLSALHALANEERKRRGPGAANLSLEPGQVGFVDERGYLLRDKILGRVHLERDLEAIGRFNVRGAVQVDVQAMGLLGRAFEPPDEYDMYEATRTLRFTPPAVNGCTVQHSVEAALSAKDRISLGAHMLTRGNAGIHSLTTTYEHDFSDVSSGELGFTSSTRDPLGVSLKGNRNLDPYTKGSLELVMRDHWQPGLNVQAVRKLTNTLTGILQLGFGIESGLLLQLNHASRFAKRRFRSKREQEEEYYRNFYADKGGSDEASSWGGVKQDYKSAQADHDEDYADPGLFTSLVSNGSAMLFVSGGALGLHLSWARSLSARSQGKLGLKLSTANVELELTSSRLLSAHSKGNISIALGLGGVKLTLRYDRGGIRYVLPLKLASGLSFGAALVGGAVPTAINFVVYNLVRPLYAARVARNRFRTDERLLEARERALVQMRILAKTAAKHRQDAVDKHGLVILRARYGSRLHEPCDWRPVAAPKLDEYVTTEQRRSRAPSDWDIDEDAATGDEDDDDATEPADMLEDREVPEPEKVDTYTAHPPNIDVTEQLSFFATADALELHGGTTKANLIGFYNPCEGRGGSGPELYIRYQLGSWVFELTVDDLEPVALPSPRATLVGNVLTNPAVDFAAR